VGSAEAVLAVVDPLPAEASWSGDEDRGAEGAQGGRKPRPARRATDFALGALPLSDLVHGKRPRGLFARAPIVARPSLCETATTATDRKHGPVNTVAYEYWLRVVRGGRSFCPRCR
jgi:hypothetical protein